MTLAPRPARRQLTAAPDAPEPMTSTSATAGWVIVLRLAPARWQLAHALQAIDGLNERGPQRGHEKHCRVHVLRGADVRSVRAVATRRYQRRDPRPQRGRTLRIEHRETARLTDRHLSPADLQPIVGAIGLSDAVPALFSVVSQASEMYNALINLELDRCSGRSYPTDHVGEGIMEARPWLRNTE